MGKSGLQRGARRPGVRGGERSRKAGQRETGSEVDTGPGAWPRPSPRGSVLGPEAAAAGGRALHAKSGGSVRAPSPARSESETNRWFLHGGRSPHPTFRSCPVQSGSGPGAGSSPGGGPSLPPECVRVRLRPVRTPPPSWREPLPHRIPLPLWVRAGSRARAATATSAAAAALIPHPPPWPRTSPRPLPTPKTISTAPSVRRCSKRRCGPRPVSTCE